MRVPISRLCRIKNIVILGLTVTSIHLLWNLATLDRQMKDKSKTVIKDDLNDINHINKQQQLQVKLDQSLPMQKIDWNDYSFIKYEQSRAGIGEHGVPAALSDSDKELEKQLYAVNGFNGALSDKISVNRSVPDIRHKDCRTRKYLSDLPTVSVVVPVHNEHWSTLLRTVHGVVNRSPPGLLKEILLVDDASTKEFLGSKLEQYLSEHVPKARVLRVRERRGLITARLVGARNATADVLLFLDSHTEPNVNWLPPLLEPIALDHRTVVCPFIDVVAYDTFEYRAQDEGARGAFDWELYYKRLPLLPADLNNMPDPFPSPVMAGGLFAISRQFFWELGGYDPGLDIWGGEQYELSFKIWQCGGRMLDAPCSRVGHIYRHGAPFPNPGHGDFVAKNYRRVAEVWMDEYAEYLYARRPHYRRVDTGDLSEQRALRRRLRCKSFRWFLTQVAFDLTNKYPPVEPLPFAEGKIRSASKPELCVDAANGAQLDRLRFGRCDAGKETEFTLSWHKDIRSKRRNMCWDVPETKPGSPVLLYSCHLGGGNQLWRYLQDTKQLRIGTYANCLEHNSTAVFVSSCDVANPRQRWIIDTLHKDALARWDDIHQQVTAPVEIVNE